MSLLLHRSLFILLIVGSFKSLISKATWTESRKSTLKNEHEICRTQVLLYHKPVDVVTTHATDDVLGRLNVFQDLLQRCRTDVNLPFNFPTGWHAVGRLDAATSGLLLLTNDGGLVHHVTNYKAASNNNASLGPIPKTYEALVMGHHETDSLIFERFRQGCIEIRKNQFTLPVQDVKVLDHPTAKMTLVSLTILEGMNRQVRLMFHACGSGVMRLRRTAIGSVNDCCYFIDMVPNEGDWLLLTDQEVQSVLNWKCRSLHVPMPALTTKKLGVKTSSQRHPKRSNRKT